MKHAYLIISHDEFEILRILVHALDDERNDIYVHIDKKVKQLPKIEVKHCRLFFLQDRLDVRWGNVSQIKVELLLFEKAHGNGSYDFYHLISGTHIPIIKNDSLMSFFEQYRGKCIFSNAYMGDGGTQETLKMHHINICTRGFASHNKAVSSISQFVWKSFNAIQRLLNIKVNKNVTFYYARNWCSLSQEGVEYLLAKRNDIKKRYRWSFCGDEWFAITELMNSPLRDTVIRDDALLYCKMNRANALALSVADYDNIVSSGCLFARKFTSKDMALVNAILEREK